MNTPIPIITVKNLSFLIWCFMIWCVYVNMIILAEFTHHCRSKILTIFVCFGHGWTMMGTTGTDSGTGQRKPVGTTIPIRQQSPLGTSGQWASLLGTGHPLWALSGPAPSVQWAAGTTITSGHQASLPGTSGHLYCTPAGSTGYEKKEK